MTIPQASLMALPALGIAKPSGFDGTFATFGLLAPEDRISVFQSAPRSDERGDRAQVYPLGAKGFCCDLAKLSKNEAHLSPFPGPEYRISLRNSNLASLRKGAKCVEA